MIYTEPASTSSAPLPAQSSQPPATPELIIEPGDGEVFLSGLSDETANEWEYRYREATDSGTPDWQSTHLTGFSVRIPVTGLTNGTAYAFQVRARNANGWSNPSLELQATPEVPEAPQVDGVGTWESPYQPLNVTEFAREARIQTLLRGTGEAVLDQNDIVAVFEFDAEFAGLYQVEFNAPEANREFWICLQAQDHLGLYSANLWPVRIFTDEDTGAASIRLGEDLAGRKLRVALAVEDSEDPPVVLADARLTFTPPPISAATRDENYEDPVAQYSPGDQVGFAPPDRITDLSVIVPGQEISRERYLIDRNQRNLVIDFDLLKPNTAIQLQFSGAGRLGVGQVVVIEGTQFGTAIADGSYFEALDYSTVLTDPFGNVTREVRSATRLHRLNALMHTSEIDGFENMINSLRGAGLALFIGDTIDYKWAFGFVRQSQVYYQEGIHAQARLIIQGVI
ncbi:MAG: fibronectin type III domain-containing protein [Candidatus Dadabacteria bacterium]|nr:fibronectin type III domain-containing protein [Candidatus Dadabacteria bacterium]